MTAVGPGAQPELPADGHPRPTVIKGSDAPPALRAVRGRYAGIASRIIANSIDVVVIAVAAIGTVWFTQVAWAIINLEPVNSVDLPPAVTVLIVPGIMFLYFPLGWTLFGKTAGKAIMGLRVVRPDGRHLGFIRAELRLFFALMLIFVGYWWILVDHRRRAWHDLIVRTVVVYDWDDARLRELPPVAPHE